MPPAVWGDSTAAGLMPAARATSRLARRAGVVLLMMLLFTSLSPNAAQAQEGDNRAGLVIVHGDGSVVQQCVAFAEESISGYELLQRGGAALSVEAGGFGATVCSIDGEGCSYPAESCFCQCQSSPCIYWSYWRQQPGGPWRYQPLGAGNTQVRNGDVEGWRWAAGTRSSAVEPPAVHFEDICAPEAQAVGATQPVSGTQAANVTDSPIDSATDSAIDSETVQVSVETPASAAAQPAVASAATAAPPVAGENEVAAGPGVEQVGVDLRGLWGVLAAVVILPAAVLLLWALVRRKR